MTEQLHMYVDGSSLSWCGGKSRKDFVADHGLLHTAGWAFKLVGNGVNREQCGPIIGSKPYLRSMTAELVAVRQALHYIYTTPEFKARRIIIRCDCWTIHEIINDVLQLASYLNITPAEAVQHKDNLTKNKDQELWEDIMTMWADLDVDMMHIKAHTGHRHNERVDKLAKRVWKSRSIIQKPQIITEPVYH